MKKKIAVFLIAALLAALCPHAAVQAEEPALTVPQIRITTEDGNGTTLEKIQGYVNATVTITDTDGTTVTDTAQFKVRGNSTALPFITKKAFTFKYEKKKDVLGMGKAKKWALLANTFDPTLMRNDIVLETAQRMGMAYTSQRRYVELWVDDSFRGCYLLTEPIQAGAARVDIDTEGNDGLKDFMIEREATRFELDVSYFKTDGIRFSVKEPEEPTAEQLAYIQSTMDDIMTVIKTGSEEEIREKIDVPSFTRYYLLNEIYKTVDFDFSSVFFYYKDGVLYAGPAWDYDLSAGNSNRSYSATAAAAFDPTGAFAADKHLYRYLCRYDWFLQEIRETYLLYYDDFEAICGGAYIDSLLSRYGEVFDRNDTDAGWSPSRYWVNVQRKPDATYEENLDYLRGWLKTRNTWLREYWNVWLIGDADGDFEITILDATRIQRLLASFEIDDPQLSVARGRTSDEELSILDATYIQRWLAEYRDGRPIGRPRLV